MKIAADPFFWLRSGTEWYGVVRSEDKKRYYERHKRSLIFFTIFLQIKLDKQSLIGVQYEKNRKTMKQNGRKL